MDRTALAEGLTYQIVDDGVPGAFKDAEVYALDMDSLSAGTKCRGDSEVQAESVLRRLEKIP